MKREDRKGRIIEAKGFMVNMSCLEGLMRYYGVEPYNKSDNIEKRNSKYMKSIKEKYSKTDILRCISLLKYGGLIREGDCYENY